MSINKEIVEENHVVQMKKTQLLCNQSYLANFPSYRE